MTQKLVLPELPSPDSPHYNDYVMMHIAHNQHLKADEARAALNLYDEKEREQVQLFIDLIALRKQMLDLEPSKSILDSVAEKYREVDSKNYVSKDDWIKARLSIGDNIQIASDLDKTISITDSYQNHIVSSVAAENYMAHPANDEPSFIVAVVRYWSHAIKHTPNELRRIGQIIEFRPGVKEFFARAKELQYPTVIASRNFYPVVEGVVDQFPENTFEGIHAIKHDDISAMDKGTVLRSRVIKHPNSALIFIGDGTSDLPTLSPEARAIIGCYFALEGSKFAKKLEAENLPHYTYSNFHNIAEILKQLGIF